MVKSKTQSKIKSIGDLISSLAPKLGLDRKLPAHQLHTRWSELVGKKLADNTCPLELKHGKLIILTSSSAWLNELHYLKSNILKTIREHDQSLNITEIVFKLGTQKQMDQLREMIEQ